MANSQSENAGGRVKRHPQGRKHTYKPEYCERVIELGREGNSEAEISVEIDVPRATIYRWKQEIPEFAAAMQRAKDCEQHWWERQGKAGMWADKFNAQVWTRSMSARFRNDYAERKELSGPNGAPIEISGGTAKVAALLESMKPDATTDNGEV